MKEADYLSFKHELWYIIRTEGIVVKNQNLDFLLQRAYKELSDEKNNTRRHIANDTAIGKVCKANIKRIRG